MGFLGVMEVRRSNVQILDNNDVVDTCLVCGEVIPPGPDFCSNKCEEKFLAKERGSACKECHSIGFHKMSCDSRGLAPTFDLPTYPGRG